jgi:hypothetical protein
MFTLGTRSRPKTKLLTKTTRGCTLYNSTMSIHVLPTSLQLVSIHHPRKIFSFIPFTNIYSIQHPGLGRNSFVQNVSHWSTPPGAKGSWLAVATATTALTTFLDSPDSSIFCLISSSAELRAHPDSFLIPETT